MKGGNFFELTAAQSGKWADLELDLAPLVNASVNPLKIVRVDSAFPAVILDPSKTIEEQSQGDAAMAMFGRLKVEVFIQIFPGMPNVAAWRSASGVAGGWQDFKRLPLGTNNTLALLIGRKMAEYVNHLFRKFVAAGGDPSKFHVEYANEVYVGGAGFPNNDTMNWGTEIEAYNGGFFTGYWDTTAHWNTNTPNGWQDLLTEPPTFTIAGFHNFAEVCVPEFMRSLDSRIRCWLPAFGCENLTNELATWRPAGFTWYNHPRFYTNGRLNVSIHSYQSVISTKSNDPEKIADEMVKIAVTRRAAIQKNLGIPADFNLLEWGFSNTWLNAGIRRNEQWLKGRILNAMDVRLEAAGFEYNGVFTIGSWTSGIDEFGLILNDGSMTGAMQQIYQNSGYDQTLSPSGEAFVYTTGEQHPGEIIVVPDPL